MMKKKLVIFDMDGLMFDTERIYYKAWQEAAKAYGYEITWEIYKQIVARNSRYIEKVLKQILGNDFPYEAVCEKKRTLADTQVETEGIQHKEGLLELLDNLDQKGIQKVVATSSMREKAIHYLTLGGIKDRFDWIICGCDVEESKPNPEIFLKAAAHLGIAPVDCMVLEDSKLGIKAARAAEMTGVLVPDLVQPDQEMLEDASYVVASLREVMALLD
ncbi:MAG: HAD family phosphatase [Cellulosilyticum sp.]|nr:HAD family phosphatase [Cellulosilyticum sp.]